MGFRAFGCLGCFRFACPFGYLWVYFGVFWCDSLGCFRVFSGTFRVSSYDAGISGVFGWLGNSGFLGFPVGFWPGFLWWVLGWGEFGVLGFML